MVPCTIRIHASPCDICGGQCDNWTSFAPIASVSSYPYNYTNAEYSSFIHMLLLPERQIAETRTPSKKNNLSVAAGLRIEYDFQYSRH